MLVHLQFTGDLDGKYGIYGQSDTTADAWLINLINKGSSNILSPQFPLIISLSPKNHMWTTILRWFLRVKLDVVRKLTANELSALVVLPLISVIFFFIFSNFGYCNE